MADRGRYLRPERGVARGTTRKKRGYLLIILVTTLLIAVAAGLTYFSYQVVTSPDQFTPKKLVIKGAVLADSTAIRERVNQTIGSNMLVADLEIVCREVETLPWVAVASARKIIPDTIELTISEKRPVAFAVIDGVIHLLDEQGTIIGPLKPELPFSDLPLVMGLDELSEEMRAVQMKRAVEIIATLTRRALWKERLQEIDVSVAGGERLHLKEGLAPVILGHEEVDRRLTKYLLVEASLRERYDAVEYIDVRFNNQVVVNGSGNSIGKKR